ncbi:3,4-dihydroxy-2-butanone-4-phosphate synthase [Ectopseudomonas khazarica]|uniref:3,4-dihydroxy-2-butanone-4-phosphate synthase n=1 Tax=Ectopseudomonas khazarica TaxID=2502979 RepID=UPI003B95CC00
MRFDSVQHLLKMLRNGGMVVITDDEQDGEGSLLMAAERTDAEAVNFMAMHARGLICLGLSEAHCKRLGLSLMVPHSRATHGVGFTCSIEAREGVTTGISVADRAHSIQVAVDPGSVAADIVQPGHVFPVQALSGGVMQRAGHAEAACDLARGDELQTFAQRHGLPICSIAELIHYRILHEGTIRRSGQYSLTTRHGEFRVMSFQDTYQGQLHLALVRGEIDRERPTLVRVQAIETLRDALGCDSEGTSLQWNLERSLAHIAAVGTGVLVLLAQHESPEATLEQLRLHGAGQARAPQFPQRTLGIGAQILRDVGVRRMQLMSTEVPYKAVSGFELEVVEFVPFTC